MLNSLKIEQFAIIDSSQITFEAGFNVLSGETGAGKSILIDALSLALGERADATMIRHGADKATVQAIFEPISNELSEQLQEDGLENDDDPSSCFIRRQVRSSGSKAFVNDHAITSKTLKGISESLISIHGQQANQSLLKPSAQRLRLDRFAEVTALKLEVKESYRTWQQALLAFEQWQAQRHSQEERLALLRYQLEELNQIAPQQDEFAQLSNQHASLSAADEILSNGQQLIELLQENDDHSVNSLLHQSKQLLSKLAQTDSRFVEADELLNQCIIYADEAYDSIVHDLQNIEHNPQQLTEIDARMSAIHALARKHHTDPDALYEHWQTLLEEFDTLNDISGNGEQLSQQVSEHQQLYKQLASTLSQRRSEAAQQLAQEVEHWIRQLGMGQAEFFVEVRPTETPAEHGMDDVQFLLCANPGQKAQPLQKVASGGELSRVSLAIEVACLDEMPVPTVIFDEIDAGIGGEVADTVGQLLHTLSANRQVLCITHLPQVAAYADAHFFISKQSEDGQTQTKVRALNNAERVKEIARMLGDANSNTSQQHAKTMLKRKEISKLKH